MSANFGRQFRLSIFGESHGGGIGMVIDGIPAGFPIDEDAIAYHMARRAPGNDPTATARKEPDRVKIVSGILDGHATGAPLCGIIENTNTRSGDYAQLRSRMRPGHADYAGFVKYGGYNDPRGGGHFSGRITAPLVFAGSIARQILQKQGVTVGAHIAAIGPLADTRFDPVSLTADALTALHESRFPLLNTSMEQPMRAHIDAARMRQDSTGGVIECAATGVRAGVGSPFFDSLESVTAHLLFSVPAVKGVEFGDGFAISAMHGSEANDPMRVVNGHVTCTSNHNGGITGGITNGMPVVLRAAIKPTPSISRTQRSVNIETMQDTDLSITGRHDPCIVPRAVVVIESALALALCELMMDDAATHFI